MKKQQKKANASQRLETLETIVLGLDSKFKIVGEELDRLREALQIAIENLNELMAVSGLQKQVEENLIKKNAEKMKEQLDLMVEKGALTKKSEDESICINSYVYAREINSDGDVVNPRLHFSVKSIPEEDQKVLLGKKVGEVVFKEEKSEVGLEIMEIYKIASLDDKKKVE